MSKPTDKPNASEFGQAIAKLVSPSGKYRMTGQQARAAFGSAPGGRDWKQISDQGKAAMRNYPKA